MTLLEAQQQADSRVVAYWPTIQAAQQEYFAGSDYEPSEDIPDPAPRHRYVQMLPICSAIPEDGQLVAVDQDAIAPTVQAETWLSFGIPLPSEVASRVRIDTYEGPSGAGYVVIQELKFGGILYRKSINVGPETWRSNDWQEVPAEES